MIIKKHRLALAKIHRCRCRCSKNQPVPPVPKPVPVLRPISNHNIVRFSLNFSMNLVKNTVLIPDFSKANMKEK